MTETAQYSDAFLDGMRLRGDPPADRVIEALMAGHQADEARALLRTLVENDQPPPTGLPPEVTSYLQASANFDATAGETLVKGEDLFAEHGAVMLLCLGCYALPASYGAAKGVVVLHRTAYLERRPAKRLFETTQMVIDVMTPGGLGPGGRGVRTVQKVRLMHAMVRYFLQNDPTRPWPAELGLPINQEDLAGTLTAFVWGTLDGLARLGVTPAADAQEDYLAAWRCVGRLMGIVPELLPKNMAEATALRLRIEERQVAPSAEGRELTQALLEMMQQNSDFAPLKHVPAVLMRHFLPERVADFLGVPHYPSELAVEALEVVERADSKLLNDLPILTRVARSFSLHFLNWMLNVETGGRSAPFVIPPELKERWGLAQPASFWQRLAAWFGRTLRGLFGARPA